MGLDGLGVAVLGPDVVVPAVMADQRRERARQTAEVAEGTVEGPEGGLAQGEPRVLARFARPAVEHGRAGVPAVIADVAEEPAVIVRVLDDGADGLRAGMGSPDQGFGLPLHLLEAAVEHLQKLKIVNRIGVHHVEDVPDDGVPGGAHSDGVDDRGGVV